LKTKNIKVSKSWSWN